MIITSDMQIKNMALPSKKEKHTVTGGTGLYLLAKPSGKYWKWSYKYGGKSKDASLGVYPKVSLKEARAKLVEIKALYDQGIDPNQYKKDLKQRRIEESRVLEVQADADANTFEKVGDDWLVTMEESWVDSHAVKQRGRLRRHLYPVIGHIPVAELKRVEVVDALKLIKGGDIAHRVSQLCRSILNYACNAGLIDAVPMGGMTGVLSKYVSKSYPVILDPQRLGELLRASDAYEGTIVVEYALRLLPYLAVRAGEFRTSEWKEFDLEKALWTIPASHRKLKGQMKTDEANTQLVPLPTQAVVLLKELHEHTGRGRHVFPSIKGDAGTMSSNTINKAIWAMGFKGEMVGHSWRAVFSTKMNELGGVNPDAIERQLAHKDKDKVRAAYNKAEYPELRKEILQTFANLIDGYRGLEPRVVDGH